MTGRAAVAPIVAAALTLVALVGGSSPAARIAPPPRALDLVASAHPTSAQPSVSDAAFDVVRMRGFDIKADTAALSSSTCDQCRAESTALHVVYSWLPHRALLDNVATAWAQGCASCTSTALSVQVVVLRGRPTAVPNNRALALNAACTACRTTAVAFQVVLVADDAEALTRGELAALRAWFDEQAAAVRASLDAPLPPTPTETPSPSPEPSPTTPSLTPAPPATPSSSSPTTTPSPVPAPAVTDRRTVRRQAASALDDLTRLLTDALGAETVSADVEISR